MAYVNEPWFHATISAHDAIELLEKESHGSFLFRPSSSHGFLSLSYKGVNGDTSIHHIRVQVVGNQYITDGDPKKYDSLHLLVKARNSILTRPVYGKRAAASAQLNESDVQSLVDMGFTRQEASRALSSSKGSVEEALEVLMNSGGSGGGAGGDGAAAGPVTPVGPPMSVQPFAKGGGSSRLTIGGSTSSGLHGDFGVTEDQNVKHKSYMEDGFVMIPELAKDMAYFAVYDGHSGREAVTHIQERLHNNLLSALKSGMSVADAFTHSYQLTDQELLDNGIRSAGSTSVSALLVREGGNRVLHVANAGDARAFVCKGGRAIRMSFDHKVEDEGETKRILAAGGTILWGRVQGQTMVSRSLGDHDLKKYVIPDPFYKAEPLDKTAEFLVVACDGIWDVSEDQEICDLVRGMKDSKKMSQKIIQHVITKGTKDNLTAMVIRL